MVGLSLILMVMEGLQTRQMCSRLHSVWGTHPETGHRAGGGHRVGLWGGDAAMWAGSVHPARLGERSRKAEEGRPGPPHAMLSQEVTAEQQALPG